jgi:hypothetical protein
MTKPKLEGRVAKLERELAVVKKSLNGSGVKDWRRTIGMFTENEIMKQIDEAALAFREADRAKIKSRSRKR